MVAVEVEVVWDPLICSNTLLDGAAKEETDGDY